MAGDAASPVRRRLDGGTQRALLAALAAVVAEAPLYRPVMPRTAKPFSVLMSNCGPLGWVSDRDGYRYQPTHPETGAPWPAMPAMLLALWDEVTGYPAPPEACLINLYGAEARMGLHQDRDEADLAAPVLSVSLGDDARFRLGGTARRGPTSSFVLASGDVMTLEGPTRLAYHGVDRVYPMTSGLLDAEPAFAAGRRLNLTLRRVGAG